jgi:hypothetical protein
MSLEKEFEYYTKNQDELVKQYNGKFIVIKNEQILGAYDSQIEAYEETTKKHEVGTFLIQHCTPGESSYTQTFHSLVTFK